ncbi:MAG TPA: hypothetical protein VKA57_02830 [Solirubrobacteraceae bacterium]|nr:hypothetical protein [Solirubrobacteraceae bacterium]
MAKLRLGKRAKPTDAPTHVHGVKQGNSTGNYEKQDGHLPDGRSTAARATGINSSARDPIDPQMPNLPPA